MEEFLKFRALLYELVIRDVKIKYRRSVLGVLWTVLNPLFMMTVLYLVFSRLFRFDIENYSIYLLSGQVIFNYYQSSTTDAMLSIVGNASLIKKVYMPRHMLVVAKILSGAVNLLASFAALLTVLAATGGRIHITIFLVAIPFAYILLFSLGVGFVLAAVTVRFRDIVHLYGVLCTALFYLTPTIYPISILPFYMRMAVYFNPITGIMDIFREIVMEGSVPGLWRMLYCGLMSLFVFFEGYSIFKKRESSFILDL